jgi:hypothetical protein
MGRIGFRDLVSQVPPRLRVFMYHLSTSVVAPAGPSGYAVWHVVHPLRSRSSSACLVYQNCNSDYQIHRAGVSQLATRKVGLLTIDRIRDSPTPTRAETSRGPLINALNSRTRVFARSTRRHRTASSTNRAYSRSAIGASNCHPRPPSASHIWNHVFEVPGCAAHVLRNDRYGPVPVIGGKSVSGPASTVIVAQGQSLVGARHGVPYLALQGGSSQPHAHHRGCLLRSSGQRLRLSRRRAHRPPSQTLRCSVTPPPSTRCTLPPKSFYKRI